MSSVGVMALKSTPVKGQPKTQKTTKKQILDKKKSTKTVNLFCGCFFAGDRDGRMSSIGEMALKLTRDGTAKNKKQKTKLKKRKKST